MTDIITLSNLNFPRTQHIKWKEEAVLDFLQWKGNEVVWLVNTEQRPGPAGMTLAVILILESYPAFHLFSKE